MLVLWNTLLQKPMLQCIVASNANELVDLPCFQFSQCSLREEDKKSTGVESSINQSLNVVRNQPSKVARTLGYKLTRALGTGGEIWTTMAWSVAGGGGGRLSIAVQCMQRTIKNWVRNGHGNSFLCWGGGLMIQQKMNFLLLWIQSVVCGRKKTNYNRTPFYKSLT